MEVLFGSLCLRILPALLLTLQVASAGNGTLYILTVFPYPSEDPAMHPSWDAGASMLPAAYLAVDMINNRSDILPRYSLELINAKGGCNFPNNARVSFVEHVVSGDKQPIIGTIGPGCSTSTLAYSPLTGNPFFTLINIHLAGSPHLEDRDAFPYSVGILGSSYIFVNSTVALMRKGGWTRIIVLYDEDRIFFLSTYQALEKDLSSIIEGASIAFSSSVHNTFIPVDRISNNDARVILILTGPDFARKIMCLAQHQGLLYPRYQWLFMGRYLSDFNQDVSFSYNGLAYECSAEQLTRSLNGNLLLTYRLQTPVETVPTKSGLSYSEYVTHYQERIDLYNRGEANYVAPGYKKGNVTQDSYATIAFDGIWALALSMSKAAANGHDLFQYGQGQAEYTDIALNILYSTYFYGVSGIININSKTGFTDRVADIHQVCSANVTKIGYVEYQTLIVTTPPTLVPNEFHSTGIVVVNPIVAGFFTLIVVILVVAMIIFHVMFIVYRNHPSVKAQSVKLNQISYFGTYLFAIGSLIFIISKPLHSTISKETVGIFCQATWAFFSISFTTFFAPICARTWRLYRIFTHYLNPGPLISDPILFTAVFILIGIDVVLALIWMAVDPFHVEELRVHVTEEGDFETLYSCKVNYTYVWFPLTYLLKLFTMVVTLILSILTRKIKNNRFKTNSLRILVYLFCLILWIGLSLFYLIGYLYLAVDIHVDYTIFVAMCIGMLILSLTLVFTPPVLPILKEKISPHLYVKKYIVSIGRVVTS